MMKQKGKNLTSHYIHVVDMYFKINHGNIISPTARCVATADSPDHISLSLSDGETGAAGKESVSSNQKHLQVEVEHHR